MTDYSKGRPLEKRPEEKIAKWADLPPNVRKFAIQVSRHHLGG